MKKILSILCLITLFAQNVFVAEAEVIDTTSEQIDTIYQLGIMSENQDGEDDLSEKITRAVFAEMVYKFLYDGTLSGATKSYFNDVDLYHYAAPYIQMLSEGGIISGYGDGNFYPDKNITINEAVAIILRAIGYDIQLSTGKSVKSVASDADIGVGLDFSKELTKKDAAEILYDTLYADTLKSTFEGDAIGRAGKVMFEFLGLKYKDGVVDGINGKSLYDQYIREGVVSIDEIQYNITCSADDSLLGKYVRYYYSEEDEEVRAVVPRKNEVLVINAPSVIGGSNTEITYYNQNGGRKTAKISAKADILYNGYVINDIGAYLPQSGEITLIDRKDDGSYDAVFITEYTSYFVARASMHDETITLYNTDEVIDLTAYDEKEIVDKNNSALELNAISSNSVISVYRSGTKKIKIVKADDTVTGVIADIGEDDYGKTVITIGERQITLCGNCYLGGMTLSFNANVTVYLDAFGMGAAIKTGNGEEWEYGYLISAKEDDGSLMEMSIRLKVLNMSGEHETLYIVDKTRIDGAKVRIGNAMDYLNSVFNNFNDEIAGGEEYKKELVTTRLIRFKRNENIIPQLDTPVRFGLYEERGKPAMTEGDKLLLRVKGNLYIPENRLNLKAVYTNYTDLAGELFYSDNTPVFVIPTEENTDADKEDYTVIPGKELRSTYGEFVYVSAYYTDLESFTPEVIVVRKDTFKSGDTRLLVVNKTKKVWDEKEGEILTQIEGYINGSLTAMVVDEKNSAVSLSSIKSGDCIAYDMYDEKLRLTQLMYRAGGGGALNDNYFWSKNGESLFNTSFRALIGKAGNINDNYMHLKLESEGKIDELISLPSNIAFYDSSEPRNSVHMGDYTGISANDIVIVSSRKGVQQDVIVIK